MRPAVSPTSVIPAKAGIPLPLPPKRDASLRWHDGSRGVERQLSPNSATPAKAGIPLPLPPKRDAGLRWHDVSRGGGRRRMKTCF